MNLYILIQIMFLIVSATMVDAHSMTKANCTSMCGNVRIPYPFGIGKGCYLDEWYAITCNSTFNPRKPFLSKYNMEVLAVNFTDHTIRVMNPVASNCQRREGNTTWSSINFAGSPYTFSRRNQFVVVGCDTALLSDHDDEIIIGCGSTCKPDTTVEGCYGINNCCKVSFPSYPEKRMTFYTISIAENTTIGCTYAFPVFVENYDSSFMNTTKNAPVEVSWGVKSVGDRHSYCGYVGVGDPDENICVCQGWQYTGNPYIPNGCQIVEACANCKTECDYVTRTTGREDFCRYTYRGEKILGSTIGVGLFFLLLCGFFIGLYKQVKKKRISNLKKKFFKRNGGLLLEQQISSDEGKLKKAILFTSNELEKATDKYNKNRILGQGGQGTVYKGMLADGKITAVKKSKLIDESQLDQFINEVVILSQMNHRNIVKLLGCCLETEVPLLVYEFVPNGNLFGLIHNENEEFPLSWKMRLQIATEVAGGLAYLHSASSVPIYHRDIKSTNILLDEKFRAKISDFGTSRTIAIEQTHLTTLVYGTFGYLDPEYFRSSQFTDKSDVYSFGVVLAELLTGQKPISSLIEYEDQRGLAARFMLCAEEMRVFDIVDTRIIGEAPKEEILAVSDIARRCLNVNGKKRPTMKEVMMDLEVISRAPSTLAPNSFGRDVFNIEMNENRPDRGDFSTSTMIKSDYRAFSSSDVDPLIFYTE